MLFDKVSLLYVPFYLGGYLSKWRAPSSVIFFSSYSGLNLCSSDIRVFNNHSYISNCIDSYDDNIFSRYDAVFLGQPLVQSGILTKEQYSRYIEQMIDEIGKSIRNCIYVSHPAEDVSISLNDYLLSNLTVRHLDVPVELYFWGTIKSRRIIVIGFYTSALISLAQMQVSTAIYVKSIYIREIDNIEDKRLKRIITDVYEYIDNNGIPISR